MASIDLLFSLPPNAGQPVNLVFGADEDVGVAPVDGTLTGILPQPALQGVLVVGSITQVQLSGALPAPALQGTLLVSSINAASLSGELPQPALTGLVVIGQVTNAALAAALPDPEITASFTGEYLSNTARPTVGQTQGEWQQASRTEGGIAGRMQGTVKTPAGSASEWQAGQPLDTGAAPGFSRAVSTGNSREAAFQNAMPHAAQALAVYSDAQRSMRAMLQTAFQAAEKAQTPLNRQRHQDGIRDKTGAIKSTWQQALRGMSAGTTGTASPGLPLLKGWGAVYENAMRPPAGMWVPPVPPATGDPCYIPDADLLFWQAPGSDLVFICERHVVVPPIPGATVVVPILRTYVTINSITLRRVDGDVPIPTYAFQMSLDVDSWTWSWSASIPAEALALVQPAGAGEPVEVEALVNGVPYRLVAEGIASQREFGRARISVKGRGKAALLDAPYAPTLNFGSTAPRTAQQLMLDALTVNGVGIGWAVDWTLTDWLVPGNTWTHQGAYIGAILDIAQAAGGYVQPHATEQTLRVLSRYPVAPWDWSDITPDYELPSAVVAVEGIDWTRKADYNRVFVSGMANGVLGQVTRAGTAGDSVAPMVTDALITHADAARQRGLAILSDTGSQARVTLTLPVLGETGLIKPGQFVRYAQGSETRLGLVRSTSLAWSRPKLRQTIAVETHA